MFLHPEGLVSIAYDVHINSMGVQDRKFSNGLVQNLFKGMIHREETFFVSMSLVFYNKLGILLGLDLYLSS